MSDQPAFPFDAIEQQRLSPTDVLPPINGTSPVSRHASYTGAVSAAVHRGEQLARVIAAWNQPRTMQDVAAHTGLPLSSVCSLKKCIADDLECVGLQTVQRQGYRDTKRTIWQLKAARRKA